MTSGPLILGIESSCDETGVGIVRGREVLANVIASSVDEQARYGGVVPEIAARAHLEAMRPTLERALEVAGVHSLLGACPSSSTNFAASAPAPVAILVACGTRAGLAGMCVP